MAKEVGKRIKLQIPAGKATPAPPVGTALGPAGINIGEFCTKFNDASKDRMGDIVPVEITIYEDKSYDFVLKTPPASFLVKKIAKIDKGSQKGANHIVATITQEQLKSIAEMKLPDLNAYDVNSAMKIVEGTARNMGVAVSGLNDQELATQEAKAEARDVEIAKRDAQLEAMEQDASNELNDVEVINEKQQATEEN